MSRKRTPDQESPETTTTTADPPAGEAKPDGQGFAAFGRVERGMDVVRKIQTAPANGQTLTPPVKILRALRKN